MRFGSAYILGVVAACALAFAVGRSWPSSQVAATRNEAAVSGQPRKPVVTPPTRRLSPAPAIRASEVGALVTRGEDQSAFLSAWRNDRVAADATRSAVIAVVERRRRERDSELRACLAGAAAAGQVLRVRFDTSVRANGAMLTVGDVRNGVVLQGPPLADDAVTCLATVLAGKDDAHAAADEAPFLADFDGVVDYTLALGFAARTNDEPDR